MTAKSVLMRPQGLRPGDVPPLAPFLATPLGRITDNLAIN